MNETSNQFRNGSAYVIGVAVFLVAAYAMEKVGLPRGYLIAWTAVYGIWMTVSAIRHEATTSPSRYFFAGRAARSTTAALAIAASVCGPFLLTDGIDFWFKSPGGFVAVAGAVALGLTLSAMFIGGPFRQSGAVNAVNLIGSRFQTVYAARLLAAAAAAICFGLMVSGIGAASQLTAWFFRLGTWQASLAVCLAIAAIAVTGGAGSQLRFATAASVSLILALTAGMVLPSSELSGLPFGQLTFGSGALVPVGELEQELASIGVPPLRDQMFTSGIMGSWTGGVALVAAVLMACGVAVLPAVLQNYASSRTAGRAVVTGARSAFFSGAIALSVVALLSYAVFDLYESIFGLAITDIETEAPHLTAWGSHSPDVVRLCGSAVSSATQAVAACGGVADYTLSTPDLSLNASLILAAAPDFMKQSFAVTAFLVLSILMVLIAFSGAAATGFASNLVSGFYAIRMSHVVSFRMFLTRLLVVVAVALAAVASAYLRLDNAAFAIGMFGLYAATALPAVVASLHWRRVTGHGLAAGMVAGFSVSVAYWLFAAFGPDMMPASGDEYLLHLPVTGQALPPELGGILGLAAGIAVLLAVSLSTRPRRNMQEDRLFLDILHGEEGEVAITRNRF